MIWTDCDREGEHIGQEIVNVARKGNAGIQVKRARFSNVERAYVQGICPRGVSGSLLISTCSPVTFSLPPGDSQTWMRSRPMRSRRGWSWTYASATPLLGS